MNRRVTSIRNFHTRLPWLFLLGWATLGSQQLQAEVLYNRDVRPLLSAHCFKCHGPDEDQRKVDLRLDIPGEIDFEEVLRRISSEDPAERMPPPKSNQHQRPLLPQQIQTLQQWIASGSVYQQHWAFLKPRKQAVQVGVHPVDQWIDAKLAEQRISPAEKADAYTLIRRVYLDLIGLPPTPAAADAFAAQPTDIAYQAIVDQLLASPQYGERWARRWLDLARYADTNGYEKDRDRSIWPYRDWVIRAINADMPFNQFTIEQLAGDMLPSPTTKQWIATGFHRNTMLNEEGGIDPLEFRFHALTDRVATTGITWLGLTIGCAQCHTHKFDPITQQNYYGLMAYLNNTDEIEFLIPDPNSKQEQRKKSAQAAASFAALPPTWPGGLKAFKKAFLQWLQSEKALRVPWEILQPVELNANFPYLTDEGHGVIFAGGDTTKHDIYQLTFAPTINQVAAIRLEALPDDRLPGGGPGMTYYEGQPGDFFLRELSIAGATIRDAKETYAKNHYNNLPASAKLATDGDLQSGWSIAQRVGERQVALFVLEQPIAAGESLKVQMHFGRHYASSLGKFRFSATAATNAKVNAHDPTINRLLTLPINDLSRSQRTVLQQAFMLETSALAAPARQITQQLKATAGTPTMVMRERPADHSRPTFLHHRGEYSQPTKQVTPHLPDALFPQNQPPPKNRWEFARWLVSPDNPLTARVVANRQWEGLFGTGLVKTVEDFGMQGEPPSHPELLDHLALFLIENQWSIKKLHRHLVTSITYQRSSHLQNPPTDERLLAHFPRQRLAAEIIRDSALHAAGLLQSEMYGPPVRPPQPEGVTEVAYGSPKWQPSLGKDRFRRSIYTYQKRTAPFAMYTTFDAGSGESCLARRDRSNTPLQALVLLNDPMFLEIADAFGKDLAASSSDVTSTITTAFRRILTRFPTQEELTMLHEFHQQHSSWPALARVLLCLDEAITKN